jgi:hypothetical protein
MHGLWTGGHGVGRTVHGLVLGGVVVAEIHGNVVGL